MATEPSSPTATRHHSVDIHLDDTNNQPKRNNKRMNNNQMKTRVVRGGISGGERRPLASKTFNRQVSLETGVTALGMDNRFKGTYSSSGEGSTALPRSGLSLGGHPCGDTVPRKGDFRIFRTKSTLSKQNSLLPSRELDPHNLNGFSGPLRQEDPVTTNVPAGRYFAALRGPELDEVRVLIKLPHHTDSSFQYFIFLFFF